MGGGIGATYISSCILLEKEYTTKREGKKVFLN